MISSASLSGRGGGRPQARMNKLAEMAAPNHMKVLRWFVSQEAVMISNASLMFGHGGWGAQARKMKISKLDFLLGRWFSEALRFFEFRCLPRDRRIAHMPRKSLYS